MLCEIDTPARRTTNRTSGSSDPLVKILFYILRISIHHELNPAIKFVCHLDYGFIGVWESEVLALHGA